MSESSAKLASHVICITMEVAAPGSRAHGSRVRILHVVGARPNFMKVAPILAQLRRREGVKQVLVHTGQHYDARMSDVFLRDLGMPDPDVHLGVGSGTHAQQTAKVMVEIEPVLVRERPDVVVVAGDVNSTVAVALVAAKMGVAIAHVEAGLRSRDWTMPEEINRVLTDRLSDRLYAPSRDACSNLFSEGIPEERVRLVGNIMVDTLRAQLPKIDQKGLLREHNVEAGRYVLVTLHRPSNVDHPETLRELWTALEQTGRREPVLFPAHPRTQARVREFGLPLPTG